MTFFSAPAGYARNLHAQFSGYGTPADILSRP